MNRKIIKIGAASCALVGMWYIVSGSYIHAKAEVAQHLLDRAWQQTVAGAGPSKPWPWADIYPVAKITFPRLGLSQIVLSGVSGEALAFGPGQAIAGDGHRVIAGHRDTSFDFLKDLETGEEIELELPDGKSWKYRVTGTAVVDSRNTELERAAPVERLTLVTCFPFDALDQGPLRYLVFSEVMAPLSET